MLSDLGNMKQPLLVFGGPYSNLPATAAMRRRAAALGIDAGQVICSGDIVAYCAQPAETVDLIRDWGIHVVMGNCEESLGFSQADCGCGFAEGSSCSTLALAWYRYADQRIDAAQRRWMRELPRALEFEMAGLRFRALHGSVASINEFVFASSDSSAKLAQIRQAGVDAVIGGHSGIPFGQAIGEHYWLNAGVIGMPANDATARGWYMLIEPAGEEIRVSWHRLDYDHALASRSTVAAGMPEYGRALADGLWPSEDILPAAERERRGRPLQPAALQIRPRQRHPHDAKRTPLSATSRD